MKYCTYLHRKEDTNEIFYVGKGLVSKKRAYETKTRSQYWKKTYKKHGLKVEILALWETEKDALDHEIFLIECFRSMGVRLVNMTNGGEGISGYKHTENFRKQQSERTKKYFQSKENKIKHGLIQAKRFTSEEAKKSHAEKIKKGWNDEKRKLASEKTKQMFVEKGHPRYKITDKVIEKVKELRQKKMTYIEIGDELNLHKATVGLICRNNWPKKSNQEKHCEK